MKQRNVKYGMQNVKSKRQSPSHSLPAKGKSIPIWTDSLPFAVYLAAFSTQYFPNFEATATL
jgi:hypothetical protein